MKILVITQYFPPDITAAAFRIADTLEYVAKQGHEVRVITAVPHKAQVKGEDRASRVLDMVTVYHSPIADVGAGGFVRYLKHYLSFCMGSVWKGIKLCAGGWRPDVIWATSPPLFVGLSGRILSLIYRRPLVLDIRDIWPDSAVSAGQLSMGGKGYKIGKKLEHYLYNKASHITCVAKPMSEYIAKETRTPINVIYNGVCGGENDKALTQPIASREGGGTRTLLFAGNLGRVQALDMVIHAFAELEQEKALGPWRLRMIGTGAHEQELKQMVEQLGISHRVSIESPMTRDAVMREMEATEALFVSLKPDAVLWLTIPSKVFDYLLAARPIVGGIVGEGRGILDSTGANICYDPKELTALKDALRHLFSHFSEMEDVADRNRSLVLDRFTREQGAETLLSVLTKYL